MVPTVLLAPDEDLQVVDKMLLVLALPRIDLTDSQQTRVAFQIVQSFFDRVPQNLDAESEQQLHSGLLMAGDALHDPARQKQDLQRDELSILLEGEGTLSMLLNPNSSFGEHWTSISGNPNEEGALFHLHAALQNVLNATDR